MSQASTVSLSLPDQAAAPGAEPAAAAPAACAASGPTSIASTTLFAGQRELLILHQGEQYRLRITRQEKLILTK